MILYRKPYTVSLPDGRALALGQRTLVMGILNITPDSFAETGPSLDPDAAVERASRLVADGADILDVGGESTRPGAEEVPADEELRRVLPVIERLRDRVNVPISIDTYKARVARAAVAAGAVIVNDISGLRYDPSLGEAVADCGAALVLMHTRGRSKTMYREARYGAVASDVAAELAESIERAVASGVPFEQLVLDPGLGFAKQAEHSYAVLAGLDAIARLDRPTLVGASRKSFLTHAIGSAPPARRDWATAGAVAASVLLGAHIVRVHDVAAMRDVARVADAVLDAARLESEH
ncbi:MAG: dihydropteroate synthase [Bacteroidales bacterium]